MKLRCKKLNILIAAVSILVIVFTSVICVMADVRQVKNNGNSESKEKLMNSAEAEDNLTKIIKSSFKKELKFNAADYHIVSEPTLKIVYNREMILEAFTMDYSLIINGKDIDDYTKELDTRVNFKKTKQGYLISRESNDILPGKIKLKINNPIYKGKYLYIYNSAMGKYLLLSDDKIDEFEIDSNEKYLITNNQLYQFQIDYRIIAAIAIVIFIMMIIYILIKKKYWFW